MEQFNYELTNNNMNYKKSRSVSFLMVFFLVMSVYLVPFATSISFGELILVLSFLWIAIRYGKISYYKDSALYIFIIYAILVTILMPLIEGVSFDGGITRMIRDSFYFIAIYIFGYTFVDYSVFRKWVRIICTVLSVLIIMQFIVYFLTGTLIPGILPNSVVATTNSLEGIYQHALVSASRNGYLKAMGFLTEGAHCGQALTIGIIVCFDFENINANTKRDYLTILLFSLASVLTFSATGLALTAFVWAIIILKLMKAGIASNVVGILFLVIIIAAFFVFFVGGDLGFESVLGRLTSAAGRDTADNSSFFRIYKGFNFWGNLPLGNKLFGIGFGNYGSLSYLASGISASYLESEYMNSFSYMLVSAGVLGFLFFAFHLRRLFVKGNANAKVMVLLLVLMSLASSPYSSVYWVWMVLFVLFNQKYSNT